MSLRKTKKSSGFTVVELIVATVVATVTLAALVGVITAFTQQYSVIAVRQNLNTDAQAAISQINDDVRNSTGVALYNMISDPNAPLTRTGTYNDVPGNPDAAASDTSYNWRMGTNRLLLMQPSRGSDNKPVYSDPATLSGPVNIIVYYVKNATLYRRVISDVVNTIPTLTCSVETTGGCTQGSVVDKKIVGNLNTSGSVDGASSFVVTYYDNNHLQIPLQPGPDGNPDYYPFSNTQSVAVNLDLGKNQTGTSLVDAKGALTQIRSTTPVQVTQKSLFPSSLVAGPGGIRGYMSGQLYAQTVATSGPIDLNWNAVIGSADQPANVMTSNKYCGSGATYGTVTCATKPVSMVYGSKIFGNLCATNQTTNPGVGGSTVGPGLNGTQYTLGYKPNCTAPDVVTPKFDKGAFTSKMLPTSKQGSDASCNGIFGTNTSTLDANTTYTTSNVSLLRCTAMLKGNVYIKKDLFLTYGATLKVDNSVTERPIIVVNGKVTLNWSSSIQPNASGIAPYIVSFDSSNAACSDSDTNCCNAFDNDGCAPIAFSNGDLQNSISRNAISIFYSVATPGTLFQSYYAGIRLTWNGTIRAGALSGQRISYESGSKIILDQ
ncbi:type II secretion system protein [Candidatus Saccharibacteria bacterium]|nr:type II secretion system protein [Candidatus Saccharibacteria bacterium]